jgi:hypothetical protein
MTSEQYAQYIKDDIDRWTKVAKDRKITLD